MFKFLIKLKIKIIILLIIYQNKKVKNFLNFKSDQKLKIITKIILSKNLAFLFLKLKLFLVI